MSDCRYLFIKIDTVALGENYEIGHRKALLFGLPVDLISDFCRPDPL